MNYAKLYMRCFHNRTLDLENTFYFVSRFAGKNATVVELGAGTGRNAVKIRDQKITLVDSSSDMLEILKQKIGSDLPHEILVRESFRLALESGTVDGVFLSANTLAEMLPISFTLAEISRILKVEGLLHFLNENPYDLIRSKPGYIQPVPGHTGDVYRLATRPCGLFGRFGFETVFQYEGSSSFRIGIPQVLPDLAHFKKILPLVELKIVESFGDLKRTKPANRTSQFLNLICEKVPESKNPVRFEGLLRFYDKMANGYDGVTQTGQYKVPDALIKITGDLRDQKLKVLDLGSANGFLGRTLRSHGCQWDFFGVDFSGEMVRECIAAGEYASVIRADLNFGIPVIEDEVFDMALALGVSEFISSPRDFVADVYRILHKGGAGIFTFERTTASSLKRGKVQTNGVVKFHYKKEQVVKLLESVGFKIESLESFDGYLSPSLSRWIPYFLVRARKL